MYKQLQVVCINSSFHAGTFLWCWSVVWLVVSSLIPIVFYVVVSVLCPSGLSASITHPIDQLSVVVDVVVSVVAIVSGAF